MHQQRWTRRPGDQVVRRPRQREIAPVHLKALPLRVPRRWVTSPFILAYGFLLLILAGWFLLSLPIANVPREFTPWMTGLFTATSAVTVTGLTIADTSSYWSIFGQTVILALVFVGGVGFMTGGTILLILIGRRITLAERLVLRESLGESRLGGVVRLARNIFIISAAIQFLGTVILFLHFSSRFPTWTAVWQAMFHAVSAFNNAGFSIFPGRYLTQFPLDYYTLGILALLVVLGGLSFSVLVDVVRHRRFNRFTLDTRLVLVTTAILWVAGAIAFFAFESRNAATLQGLPMSAQVSNAIFHSVSARTAGFSAVDFGATHQQTNFFYAALMFIGGASGSTAGGIKVNTLATIVVAVLAALRGRPAAEAFGREVPFAQVYRALAVVLMAALVVFGVALTLTVVEQLQFIDLLFETVSAFGTVGLSTGITGYLSHVGQFILVVTMFAGRLGPLTVGLVLAQGEERSRAPYRYAQERVKIG